MKISLFLSMMTCIDIYLYIADITQNIRFSWTNSSWQHQLIWYINNFLTGQFDCRGLSVEPGAGDGEQEQLHPDLLRPREHLQPRGVWDQPRPPTHKYAHHYIANYYYYYCQHTSTLIITLPHIATHCQHTSTLIITLPTIYPVQGWLPCCFLLSCPCQNVHPEPGEASMLHTAQLGYALIGFCKLYEFYFYDRTEEN